MQRAIGVGGYMAYGQFELLIRFVIFLGWCSTKVSPTTPCLPKVVFMMAFAPLAWSLNQWRIFYGSVPLRYLVGIRFNLNWQTFFRGICISMQSCLMIPNQWSKIPWLVFGTIWESPPYVSLGNFVENMFLITRLVLNQLFCNYDEMEYACNSLQKGHYWLEMPNC